MQIFITVVGVDNLSGPTATCAVTTTHTPQQQQQQQTEEPRR